MSLSSPTSIVLEESKGVGSGRGAANGATQFDSEGYAAGVRDLRGSVSPAARNGIAGLPAPLRQIGPIVALPSNSRDDGERRLSC
jgi:hypothetical protein